MRILVASAAIAVALTAGCSGPEPEPITLEPNRVTVDNRSSTDWKDVEIWLNTYYRVTTPSILSHQRFQAPLDVFVAGFGQRFDYRRTQVNDVRLTAKLPDGKPFELKKEMIPGGLAGMLPRKR